MDAKSDVDTSVPAIGPPLTIAKGAIPDTPEVKPSDAKEPEVKAPEAKKPCRVCGTPLPVPGARKCVQCKGYQDGSDCRVCGYAMPAGLVRCPECKSYQNWRRFVVSGGILGGLLALLPIVKDLAPQVASLWNYRSTTTAYVLRVQRDPVNTNEYQLLVQVFNSGGRPSIVRNARLAFPGLPIGDTEAMILNEQAMLLLPGKSAVLQLKVKALVASVPPEQVLNELKREASSPRVRVTLNVTETTRLGESRSQAITDTISADVIDKGFFERYVLYKS